MKRNLIQITPRIARLCLLAGFAVASLAQASLFVKTNNLTALNLAGSWTNNAVPGASDIAQWDSTVSDPNNTTNTLGTGMSWNGIKIINPAAKIQINAGSILTNGASGIDMTAATTDLAFSNTVQIAAGAQQQWNVANGHTLSVLATPTKPGQPANNTGQLQVGTTGTVRFGSVAATTIADNQGNPWVTYGLNDWAALDGSGNVIAATYTTAAGTMTAGVFNDITADIPGGAGSAIDVPGLRFNDSTFHTVNLANSGTSRTFTCRGILVTANSGGGLISGSAASSFIRPARTTIANTSWNIIQNSPNDFTIGVNISDGSSSAPNHLVKSGPGNLIIGLRADGSQAATASGGMDINGGTLTIAAGASTGSGAVVINNGRFVVNASNTTFVARLTVGTGTTNTVKVNTTGVQQYISSVAFNAGSTVCEFSYANGAGFSATTAPLLVSNVTANGSITVNILSGSPSVGIFPLIKYTNSLAGTGYPAFTLGALPLRATGYLSNDLANTSIDLVITNISEPLKWATGSGVWNISGTANWKDALGATTTYQELNGFGDTVIFEDSLSGVSPIAVTLNQSVIPATVTVNATKNYTISGSGSIGGNTSLTKTNSGTLTLSTANAFNGGLYLGGGIVSFSSLTNLGGGGINFLGGALQYASGNGDDISVRTVWFGPGGGTIDDGGNNINFAGPIGNSGPGGFTKTGAGSLTLNGTNKYSGSTLISNGTLALGANTYISNSPSITVNGGAVLDVASSGVGLRLSPSVSQVLAGVGTVNGSVTCPSGTAVTPGTSVGTLTLGDLTMSGGTNVLDISTIPAQRDLIVANNLTLTSGAIQLVAANALSSGVYKLIQYSGSLISGTGSSGNLAIVVTGVAQPGKALTLSDSVSGEIDLIVADNASDIIVWSGAGANWDTIGSANWFMGGATPWAYTNGDAVTFDEVGILQPNVQLQGVFLPSSVIVSNETATYTFADGTGTGGGKISGTTKLTKKGPGTLLIQTDNNNSGATDIQNGTVQIGSASIGDIGTGNITNNGALVFQQNASRNVAGIISGNGPLTQQGTATLTLAQNNTYSGLTTISAGTLQIGNGGATGTLGTNNVVDNAGLAFNRSTALIVSNTISGAGSVSVNNGTITLTASNYYTGGTTINAGKLVLGSATAIAAEGNFTVQVAGTNDLNGHDLTVTRLNNANPASGGAGRIVNNAGTATNILTIDYTTGTADNSIAILDNEGTGGKIAVVKTGTGSQVMRGNSTYTGGTIVSNGGFNLRGGTPLGAGLVTLRGGNLSFAGITFANPIQADTNATLDSGGAANVTLTGNITTASNLTVVIDNNETWTWNGAATQWAGMTGTIFISPGPGFFRFNGSRGSASATFDMTGSTATINTTGSGTFELGALVGDAGGFLGGASGAIFAIGGKNLNTTFSGTLNAVNNSIVKVGSGTLTLDGSTIAFTGATTVSNGVLAIASVANPNAALDSFTSIAVRSAGTLDVSARADATLNLGAGAVNQTLSGGGVIAGALNEAALGTLNPGDGIGKLTVTGAATLAGTNIFELNRTNSASAATNDMLSAASFTVSGGVLTVTNLGPDLITGDSFKLFNQAVPNNFTAVNLPVSNAVNTVQYVWNNKLAVDGSIVLTQGASPLVNYSTNITATVSGNTITVSWPATHIGWELLVQTNSLSLGLANNWITNFGTASVTSTNFTIDPTKGAVFYRLVHP